KGLPLATLQTNWFIGSMLTEIAFVFSIRTKQFFLFASAPSTSLFIAASLIAIGSVIIPFVPIAQSALGFVTPQPYHLALIVGIVAAYIIVTDIVKWILYKVGIEG